MFVGSLFWCLTSASFYFIDTLDIPLIYLMVLLRGIFSSVGLLIPLSMLSDAIAKEEREKAVRREALYYSIFTMFLKFSLALCFFGSAFILDALGYDTPESSEEFDPSSFFFLLIPFSFSDRCVCPLQRL